MDMPFRWCRGLDLGQIPDDYLEWPRGACEREPW